MKREELGMKLKQIGVGNKQSARMGVVELMLHVPAQINSTTGKNNSPLLSGRTRRGGTLKSNDTRRFVNFIDKNPILSLSRVSGDVNRTSAQRADEIALNMTFKRIFPFALKRMITAFRRQWLFIDDHAHYFGKFMHIPTAFLHKFTLSFERAGKSRSQHGLIVQIVRIIPIKVFKHFLKSIKTTQCGRYLTPHHGSAFLNDGDSLGIGHIVVRGADRTFAVRVKPVIVSGFYSRSKGKDNRPFRHFTGHVNNQPMVSRNVYGLCHGHAESIA
jgi:hypothetical protein